jgi:3-ketosteroid 9alpha-monooxygenase subunit B
MANIAANPVAPRMATFDTVVLESIVETADTRTLLLDPGAEVRPWRAGQYLSIDPHQFPGLQSVIAYLEQMKGRREAPRAYSMKSTPDEPHLAVTVKEEVFAAEKMKYPPLISGFLVHQVRAGDRVNVRGFAGAYLLPDNIEAMTDHVLHLCAGSGSVPNLSMVKDSLQGHRRLRHTFMYSNKTWDDIIFRDELSRLEAKHPERLRVIHALTRQTGPLPRQADVRSGRIDVRLLQEVLDREPTSLVYSCGPAISVWDRRAAAAMGVAPTPQFLETMIAHLHTLGVPADRIKVESYG